MELGFKYKNIKEAKEKVSKEAPNGSSAQTAIC